MQTWRSALLLLLVAALVVPFASLPGFAHTGHGATVTQHTTPSFDGTTLAFTVFQPAGANATEPVPMVFSGHGWGGTRTKTVSGIVHTLVEAGYGVLSFDARGHGESGGLATIHHRDVEVKDTQALIDWAYDNLGWVAKEPSSGIPKDILLGAVGGSYGGGFQTTAASYDHRFDALAPQITWNDLRYSLAPGGVVKSTWVDALYGAGLASVDMDPRIHEWFRDATVFNELPQAAADHLAGSNPVPSAITAPTLFFQGVPDLLFNVNEALANTHGVLSGGTEAALVTYNGGHILPNQPTGLGGPARSGEPCGTYGDLALAWFDKHLRGNAGAAVPSGVRWALEDGTCEAIDDYWGDTGFLGLALPDVAVSTGAGSLLLPLDATPGALAGIPHLSGTVAAAGALDVILAFGLVVVDGDTGRTWVVDDQAAFWRSDGLTDALPTIDLDLSAVATRLSANDQLFLRIDAVNEWAPTGGARAPGAAILTDLELSLPYVA